MQNVKEFKTVTISEANFKAQPSASTNSGTPNPGFDGKRIVQKGGGPVYFVWRGGYKCHIPDPTTYGNLFTTWGNILELGKDQIDQIATGEPLTEGSAMGQGGGTVYMFTNGKKHGVTSPAVMTYCQLNYGIAYPNVIVNSVPDGIIINYGG